MSRRKKGGFCVEVKIGAFGVPCLLSIIFFLVFSSKSEWLVRG